MKALLILGIVLVALLLLSLLRIGGQARYSDAGFQAWLKVGPLRFTLYPPKKKTDKTPQSRGRHPAQDRPSGQKGGVVELLKDSLSYLFDAVNHLIQKIRIDLIRLDLTVAANDPATAAIAFGGANALLGMIWPPIENHFNVKERQIRTQVDFQATQPTILIDAAFSMTIGQLLTLGVKYGLGGLLRYQAYKKAHSADRKADSYGKEPSHQ